MITESRCLQDTVSISVWYEARVAIRRDWTPMIRFFIQDGLLLQWRFTTTPDALAYEDLPVKIQLDIHSKMLDQENLKMIIPKTNDCDQGEADHKKKSG